jgi:hypothetical protein
MILYPNFTWPPSLRKRILSILTPFAVFIYLFFFTHPAQGGEALKKAVFIPQWSPQAQFAGFYMARQMDITDNRGST